MNRIDTYARSLRIDFRWGRIKAEAREEGYALLGTVFALTPSGKFYAPWACSNVRGCRRCGGSGEVKNRKGNPEEYLVVRQAAWAVREALIQTHGFWFEGRWPEGDEERANALDRAAEAIRPTHTCSWCKGTGSHEAAKDADWHDALERVAEENGLFVGGPDGADGCDVWVGDADSPALADEAL